MCRQGRGQLARRSLKQPDAEIVEYASVGVCLAAELAAVGADVRAGEFDRRDGIRSDEVGIQHAAGPRALVKLREEGVPPPTGWRQLADHPKRGLVLGSTHPTTPPDVAPMVTWLILASRLLTESGLPDTWGAVIHHR